MHVNEVRVCIGMTVLVALVIVAAQCAPADAPAQVTPVELTYVSYAYAANMSFDSFEHKLIDQFEAAHPNVEIARSVDFDTSFADHVSGSPPPDVMVAEADTVTFSAIDRGLVLDISDMWTESDLSEACLASFQPLGQRGGSRYFLPAFHGWTAMYYNKQVFTRYDLEPPATWDEFLFVGGTLLAHDVTPIALGWYDFVGGTWWFDYLDMRLNGPEFHTRLMRGEERYDDPRVEEAFHLWASLLDDGFFVEGGGALRMPESLNLVLEGEAAMMLCDSVSVADLPDKLQDTLGVFPFPVIDPAVPVGEVATTFGYLIPVDAAHPREAVEFLEYLASAQVQTIVAQQGRSAGVLPVHGGIDVATLAPESRQGWELIQRADSVAQPYISQLSPGDGMGAPVYFAFSRFLRDTRNLESALDALETARQRAFEQ